jgi:3-oxoacyl-[acyl-carrier-protein] synthase-3
MMHKAFIKAVSYYLPEQVLTNKDLSDQFPEWSVEKIATKVGINERHISKNEEFTSDMAIRAAEKLFLEHNISKNEIDFILLCTQSPDYFLPTTACIVQDKLGIPTSCGALDFNLGCSGYIYGLAMAKGLITAGIANNILLITSEAYSKYIHPKDKGNRTIFGDAAAATFITKGEMKKGIGEFILGTDGRGANNLIVKNGAVKHPQRNALETTDEYGNILSEDYLYMDGAKIFEFTLETVPKLVRETLEKNEIGKEEIDLFIFHQANKYLLSHLRKKIGISEDKFYICMDHCGNTVSSTLPIAIAHAVNDNTIKPQFKVLLAGFGVGYSWGGTIVTF